MSRGEGRRVGNGGYDVQHYDERARGHASVDFLT